ncbi:metal-dependent hydrolase [Desulfobaculum bizertense]|uniref:UPF0173 metal-dependent hydrolase SAMN02745702_00668 n=1 Tax=Desulfobaculum bizertense DSM 18034 TaxID=1121442 RepID=A0A1T4VP68_9BACT|nr:metal-dependent hydrolase [Desulfobaculum bizertense]SKA66764.1 L-ascorbate metabolism protein UlaG, beta-lactamase superfamily [Desulfobaculum bizertense DSM 18034]
MSLSVTWYSHANFLLEYDGVRILIDPFFTGNPQAPCTADEIAPVDAVLVTHDHGDHVGDAVALCAKHNVPLVTIVGTAEKLQQQGVPADCIANGIGMNIGGTLEIKGVKITMTQAFHSSESGAPTGFILRFPDGTTVYHAGDTGIFSSMQLFGELYSIDVAMLPIGGVFTMDPLQAAKACELLGCSTVIPMHWGTFPVLEQNTEHFAQALAARGLNAVKMLAPEPGTAVILEK